MERRSWPWKKKSSDKASVEKAIAALESPGASTQVNQDNFKKPNYVQISVESYSHLTGLEDQVKTNEEHVRTLEDQITELNDKLSTANSELEIKDNTAKQHAKVAEEAVSGWEKAENEALALKSHLENVTLAKLTAEDRASHLDGALKECMRQIRNLKEEHEKKLQEVVLIKTKQCEKIKNELETRISSFEKELLRAAAENAALSRSLQDHSNMLLKINQEKSEAEAEIEHLKGNIESCEREINSLKYEVHVISKELEIRNEEKNMSMKSAEVADKQHMEGAKKIAKLEAECQRLRGLMRKKLPGPAALAQMKVEVESLGRDYGESRVRKSPVKPSSPRLSPVTEFSLDNAQKFQKESEFLTERLMAMEEETKMLKEALAKRNGELQVSRSMCAKTLTKLQSLEAQFQPSNHRKVFSSSTIQTTHEGTCSQNASNLLSLTSMSEDGNDDDRSCADSWPVALIYEISQMQKEKSNQTQNGNGSTNNLELMDDFLEMEKLACSENSSADIHVSVLSSDSISEEVEENKIVTEKDVLSEKKCDLDPSPNQSSSILDLSTSHPGSESQPVSPAEIELRISAILESLSNDANLGKTLEEITGILLDTQKALSKQCSDCISQDIQPSETTCDRKANPDVGLDPEMEVTSSHLDSETWKTFTPDLESSICSIHDFVLYLGKEFLAIHATSPDDDRMKQRIEDFSTTFNKVIEKNAGLVQLIIDLSRVLAESANYRLNVFGHKGAEAESNSPDCIDKIALPENKLVSEDSSEGERYQNGCTHISSPCSNPEVPDDGIGISRFEPDNVSCKFSLEEFEELKLEKDKNAMELAKYTQDLETMKSQLQETEQILAEVKSQLASAHSSNSLAETQLKCMVESYRTLEARSQELEIELNFLRVNTETVESELQEEQEARKSLLAKCKEQEEQLQRYESAEADKDIKSTQEREMTSAAEKLAECQETIFLLGKQLKALRPQTLVKDSSDRERIEAEESLTEEKPTFSGINFQDLDSADSATFHNVQRKGAESPVDLYNSPSSPSDREAHTSPTTRHPKHVPVKSNSSSPSSTTPEKHSRGFSRFFSSKTKNGY